MSPTPNTRPVKWGVIGCGIIARNAVCPAINVSHGGELVAVASRTAKRAAQLAEEVHAPRSHGSYEALLDDPEVEAVYIGLPNGLHPEWSIRSSEAGKHVLCEKSLSLGAESARRMAEAADRSNVRLMEAYMYRHHPQWETARSLIAEGAIGEPRFVRAALVGNLSRDGENHRWSKEIGGGALFDVTCYAINMARFLFNAEPVSVQTSGTEWEPGGVDKTTTVLLDFGEERTAVATGSLALFRDQFCAVLGTEGAIHLERPVHPGREPARILLRNGKGEKTIETPGANHYLQMVEHFSACVHDPGQSLYPGEEGVAQMKVLAAAEEAWRSGTARPVS